MSSSPDLPKTYEYASVEERWQQTWKDEEHFFDPSSDRPQFVIDTPPPYPTGQFHIGNAFNWCYIDFIARYKRMSGYNVMFPQGWDCHGLPTEVKVEEIHNITKNDLPRTEFRELCRSLTRDNIEKMRRTMRRMAFSIDWSHEYITMLPEYYSLTQRSFLRMYHAGQIYQSDHPVNFCPRCETAIAFAEVSYEDRKTNLNYFIFDGIEIATTRPELLAACVAVAVHPDDNRYTSRIGTSLTVPIFHHDVLVIADEAVDPSFGSGAVMICTFGDKQDVLWWKTHNLPLRKAIDKTGHMTDIAGAFSGLSSKECQKAILAEMEKERILVRQEPLDQRVGTCWRCKTPIEILSEHQWFVKIPQAQVLQAAKDVTWYPPHMFLRMENWIEQMEWDWCISRQRLFATPIPVWFCSSCGSVILPDEREIPIDPTIDSPGRPCPACGGTEVIGETDVLDTWMDSSISVMHVTGWDGSGEIPPLYPAQIRPQGHDIIRTWAFYSILRGVSLTGSKPWENILINGMVLGEDGFKMSKSRGNITVPEEILCQYGADALRQWAGLGAATGSDIQFSWNDVIAASRFQTKLWNVARFAHLQLQRHPYDEAAPVTALIDRWILSRLSALITEVTNAMEGYQFDQALKSIREFTWDLLADNYIELAKGRLYSDGQKSRDSACVTLKILLDALCRMLAPFIPYFAEEVYSYFDKGSVHLQPWVVPYPADPSGDEMGSLVVSVVSEVRRYKHDQGLALNAPLGQVTVYTRYPVDDGDDASKALNAQVIYTTSDPDLKQVTTGFSFQMGIIGPKLRNKASKFIAAIESLPLEKKASLPDTILIDGEEVPVPQDACIPVVRYMVAGEAVDVLNVGDCLVTIAQSAS